VLPRFYYAGFVVKTNHNVVKSLQSLFCAPYLVVILSQEYWDGRDM